MSYVSYIYYVNYLSYACRSYELFKLYEVFMIQIKLLEITWICFIYNIFCFQKRLKIFSRIYKDGKDKLSKLKNWGKILKKNAKKPNNF